MLAPTRKLLKYLTEWHKEGWEVGTDVAKKILSIRSTRYRITIDKAGGFEIRRGDADFLIDRLPEKVPSGLLKAQYQKDLDLVKKLFAEVSSHLTSTYAEEVSYYVD